MDLLLIVNSVAFLIGGVCWSNRGLTNVFIKVSMFGLCMVNVLAAAYEMGYLVRGITI